MAAAPCLALIEAGGTAELPEVMVTMAEAFDPAFGEAWTGPQCAGMLGMPGSWLLIARIGGEVAGFALSRAILDEGELLLIGVRPIHRRSGIGRALLRRVIDDARRYGVRSLHLEVRAGNEAITLYDQNGFRQVGRRPGYYRGLDGVARDALTYRLDIDADS